MNRTWTARDPEVCLPNSVTLRVLKSQLYKYKAIIINIILI